MRIRWGRVIAALGGSAVGLPVLVLGGFWLTMPEPGAPARQDPGALPCVTSEVLTGGLSMHPEHDREPTRDEHDEGAAAALLAATRCEQVARIPVPQVWKVFLLATHGLAWIEANEPPDEALAQTVEIWQLSRDQQQVGSYLELAVWQAVALTASETVERLLTHDPERSLAHTRLGAQLRPALEGLAESELDWDSIRASEEQVMWDLALQSAVDGRWLLRMVTVMPKALVRVRFGKDPFLEDRRLDLEKERTRAALLAELL